MSNNKITRVSAEYIWVHNNELYSKARTIEIKSLDELEINNLKKWHYTDSENNKHTLRPLHLFNCPFRGQNGILIFCETDDVLVKSKNTTDVYSMTQEFYVINPNNMRPYGFPLNVNPKLGKNYSNRVGFENTFNRKIVDLFYKLCLASGVTISEISSSKSPSQWRYSINSQSRNNLCLHTWMSRYILHRVGEISNMIIDTSQDVPDTEHWTRSHLYITKNDSEPTEHEPDSNVYKLI